MSIKKQSMVFCFFFLNVISISNAALRDPTKPIVSPLVNESSIDEENFNLQSILIGPMRRLAMINGQIVGTGSNIQGARVLAIDKNHVVLFYAGQRRILYLFGKRLWKTH
jgi:MSHA biogenesis protein MshK